MTSNYSAYGLLIASDVPLPELVPVQPGLASKQDLTIRLGDIPEPATSERIRTGPFSWIAGTSYWLEIPELVRLLVTGGNEILIDPSPGTDEETIRTLLLGNAIGALLHQRGYLVLHGNAIRVGDQCIICMGPSGAGKSSLSAGFYKRGLDILADDVVPIDMDTRAIPGFPRIKLWHDTATNLTFDIAGLTRVRPQIKKYSVPVHEIDDQARLPVRWVYLLDTERSAEVVLEPIDGMNRLKPLLENTYSIRLIRSPEEKAAQFRQCTQLSSAVHMARIRRPSGVFSVEEIVDRILADITDHP